jgi:hypothetical protein
MFTKPWHRSEKDEASACHGVWLLSVYDFMCLHQRYEIMTFTV